MALLPAQQSLLNLLVIGQLLRQLTALSVGLLVVTFVLENFQYLGNTSHRSGKSLDKRTQGGKSDHRRAQFGQRAMFFSSPSAGQRIEHSLCPFSQFANALKAPFGT